MGGAPRKDGITADLDPLGHKNEGSGQQACKDRQQPTPRSHPSGFILPAGLAGQYSRTVHSLTEPFASLDKRWNLSARQEHLCGARDSPATLSLPGQVLRKSCHFLILLQHKTRPALKSQYCCPHTPCSSPTPVAQQKTELTCLWASGMTSGAY